MVKDILEQNFDIINRLGVFSIEETVIPSASGGRGVRVIKPIRTATDQQILDQHGKPDDMKVNQLVQLEIMKRLRFNYTIIETELRIRGREDLLKHRHEKIEMFKDIYLLYEFCYSRARILGIIVPHDRNYLSPIVNHQGVEVGDKVIPEHMADKNLPGMEKDAAEKGEDQAIADMDNAIEESEVVKDGTI